MIEASYDLMAPILEPWNTLLSYNFDMMTSNMQSDSGDMNSTVVKLQENIKASSDEKVKWLFCLNHGKNADQKSSCNHQVMTLSFIKKLVWKSI